MKIKYLTAVGKVIEPSATIPSTHQENLRILEDDSTLRLAIMEPTRIIVEDFVEKVQSSGVGYIHSGEAAKKICCDANLPQDTFHHGLAGSALNSTISLSPADIRVIASKGEDQKWFDYFNDRHHISE